MDFIFSKVFESGGFLLAFWVRRICIEWFLCGGCFVFLVYDVLNFSEAFFILSYDIY